MLALFYTLVLVDQEPLLKVVVRSLLWTIFSLPCHYFVVTPTQDFRSLLSCIYVLAVFCLLLHLMLIELKSSTCIMMFSIKNEKEMCIRMFDASIFWTFVKLWMDILCACHAIFFTFSMNYFYSPNQHGQGDMNHQMVLQ